MSIYLEKAKELLENITNATRGWEVTHQKKWLEIGEKAEAELLALIEEGDVVVVGYLPPDRLPIILGLKESPRDKGSVYKTPWSRISHSPRMGPAGEPYIPVYISRAIFDEAQDDG